MNSEISNYSALNSIHDHAFSFSWIIEPLFLERDPKRKITKGDTGGNTR